MKSLLSPTLLTLSIAALALTTGCDRNRSTTDNVSINESVSIFQTLHQTSESLYDGGGVWGSTQAGYRMALRDSYWRGDVYGFLSEVNTLYATRAAEVTDYLLLAQSQGGSGVFGFPADPENPEFGSKVQQAMETCPSCIQNGWIISLPEDYITELYYDHGYALSTLAQRYLQTQDAQLLPAINLAAEWTLDKPSTSNINYLSALSKGLSYAYLATNNPTYLNKAIELHEIGILPFLNGEGEAMDSHNAQLEYHGFIVSGLVALRQALPSDFEDTAFKNNLDYILALSTRRMAERGLTEPGDYGVTWPGTNLQAWHELSLYRSLNPDEVKAKDRAIALIEGYQDDIKNETDLFRQRKALYANFFVGFYQR